MHRYFISTITAAVLVIGTVVLASAGTVTIQPNGPEDMGSGPSAIAHLYTPGGLQGLGFIIGQPNSLTRNDRVLVRFDISSLALENKAAKRLVRAQMKFKIDGAYFRDVPTVVEVTQLVHDTSGGLVGTDMVREPSPLVAKLDIKEPKIQEYTIDVTKFVRSDLAKGRKFTAYRWRDFTAEEKGNTFVSPWFVRLIVENQDMPTLTLTFNDERVSK